MSRIGKYGAVEDQRHWVARPGTVVVERKWRYAAPPWVVYEAFVNDLDRWLHCSANEPKPALTASHRPDTVLLQPSVDPVVNAVEVRIESDGPGSAVSYLAYRRQLLGVLRRVGTFRRPTQSGARWTRPDIRSRPSRLD